MSGLLILFVLAWVCMFFVGMASTWLILALFRLLCKGLGRVIRRSLSIAS